MIKILLHIGLPKTATTSLQDNVLVPLEEKGLINIVSVTTLFERDLTDDEFESLLTEQCLNVISEERITETDKNNYDIFINRLSKLLKKYEVNTLLSLREPVDFIYSYYVQTFPQVFSQTKNLNNFKVFINQILQTPEDDIFRMFFFSSFIKFLSEKFTNINILLYEDLKYDQNVYFESLSKLLPVNKDELKNMFNKKEKNVKKQNSNGKISRGLKLTEILRIQKLKNKNRFIYSVLKICLIIELIRVIDKYLYLNKKEVLHYLPNSNDKKKIKQLLLVDNDLIEKYNLPRKKLIKYGYIE